MDSVGPRFVTRLELAATHPERADRLGRCPGLWVRGSLACLASRTVAIVGSRVPSEAGRALARRTATSLARAGVCVISGLALGIDGAAHLGALDASCPTVGVLGSGHARFFPRRNLDLAERMTAAGGAVISPFPPDHPAYPPQFLQRNGIVVALADGVVVVEAAASSGALNTAGWAANMSVPVFAFPGDVDRPKVAGCLALIRDGATLVRDAADILEGLGIRCDDRSAEQPEADAALSDLERALLSVLRSGEHTLEGLVARSTATTSATLAALVRLELLGLIEPRLGGTYALRS